jgi:hypothetical protein
MADAVTVMWSAHYRPEWDEHPRAYVEAGLVEWGRSRRLAKALDPTRAFKAFLGIQAYDPGRWHVAGECEAKFFVSLFVHGRTVSLRTFPTCAEALNLLVMFHAQLPLWTPTAR